jgi:hypothetical protein
MRAMLIPPRLEPGGESKFPPILFLESERSNTSDMREDWFHFIRSILRLGSFCDWAAEQQKELSELMQMSKPHWTML